MFRLAAIPAIAAVAVAMGVRADEDHAPMARALVDETLNAALHESVVIDALRAHNAADADTSHAGILASEKQWRAEKLSGGGPLLSSVDQNQLSTYLRVLKAGSDGLYTEILVMDSRGFLIAQSDVATDYFQGDERKYQLTYPVGPEAVFVDLVEYDESVQTIQSQVSFTITDPETGAPIGAATVGLNGDFL